MKPKAIVHAIVLASVCLAAGFYAPAAARASANAYGGHTTSGYGQTSHTNAAGGSTTHHWEGGTSHTNVAGSTSTAYAMGVNCMAEPAAEVAVNKYGTSDYLLGNTLFKPAYSATSVCYVVVAAP